MKKIVAISVMFALVAAAAFAQPAVGGQLKAGVNLFKGTSEKEVTKDNSFYSDPATGDYKTEREKYDEVSKDIASSGRTTGYPMRTLAYLNLKFGDAEMGGYARFHASRAGDWYGDSAFAFMWWRPSELFRIQIGRNADADWGAANLTGWGFNGEAQDFVALDNDSQDGLDTSITVARRTGFYGGIQGDSAVLVSLYPIEGLTVNLGLPWKNGADGDYRAIDAWLRFHAQVRYDLEEVGSIFVTYQGQGQAQNMVSDRSRNGKGEFYETDDSKNWGAKTGQVDDYGKEVYRVESPNLWLSFYGNKLVDGLAFDVGFGYQPQKANGDTPPIEIGLGATYAINEAFSIKLRTGAKLAGKTRDKYKAEAWEKDTEAEQKGLIQSGIISTGTDGKANDVYSGLYDDNGNAIKGQIKDGKLWSEDWATPTEIGVQILPSYKLSAFTFYLNAGLGFTFYPTDDGNPNRSFTAEERQKYAHSLQDAGIAKTKAIADGKTIKEQNAAFDAALYTPEQSVAISWYINPYIRKSVNGASLMAGVKLWSSGKDAGYWKGKDETSWKADGSGIAANQDIKFTTNTWYRTINWAIPIGVNVYF